MKILFVCENYIPHYGGAEMVFKNLAENYVKLGHEVSLITHQLEGTAKYEVLNGVNVYRVPSLHSRYIFTFAAIGKTIRLAKEHDIIQTTTFNGAFPAWLAGRIANKPIVLTVHEVWIGRWPQVTGFSLLKNWLHDFLERLVYLPRFDKYICVSHATREDLLKIGIPKDKAITIYNGLDYGFWDPHNFPQKKVDELRNELGLKDKFVYFSWGRPGESKGFEYLIKAVPKIAENLSNSVFLFMTKSSPRYKQKYDELLKLIRNLNLNDNIKVIESTAYEELGYYIKMADCIVVPSIAEGFGYTTTEALALEKPVVVSDAGSLPEVVSGRHLIFRSKDVDDLAKKVITASKGGYQIVPVKKFYWEHSIKKYLDIYQKIIGEKND